MGLTVRTKVRQSLIHGRGLFADEKLPKGALVWQFDSQVDRPVRSVAEGRRRFWRFDHFAYFDKYWKRWVYSTDTSKWINHATQPNLRTTKTKMYARRTIRKGEELTMNYCTDSGRCRWNDTWSAVQARSTPA
jgi:SET domain-containing protein